MGRAHTAGGVLVGSAATTAAAQFGLDFHLISRRW